jgi:hypothetical protein
LAIGTATDRRWQEQQDKMLSANSEPMNSIKWEISKNRRTI